MRPIDGDTVDKVIYEEIPLAYFWGRSLTSANKNVAAIRERIAQIPTLDAVPVVRKPVKGYEGYYEVDNLARVFSISRSVSVNDNGRIYDKPIGSRQMRQALHSNGYKVVSLTKNGITKTVFVHRIVAEAFLENEQGLPMVNHKDEDKTNNLLENLEWCDAQYNTLYGNGRKKRLKKIRGVPLSDEHKKKISEGLKRFYCAEGERKEV